MKKFLWIIIILIIIVAVVILVTGKKDEATTDGETVEKTKVELATDAYNAWNAATDETKADLATKAKTAIEEALAVEDITEEQKTMLEGYKADLE